jgi:hypothetical protein
MGEPIRHWTPEEVALLGTDIDRVIAGKIGRTRLAVQQKRWNSCMPAYCPPPTWTSDEIDMLGKYPDSEVSEKTGHSINAVMLKRRKLKIAVCGRPRNDRILWTNAELDKLLQDKSAKQLSKELGRTPYAIWKMRNRLGIHRAG